MRAAWLWIVLIFFISCSGTKPTSSDPNYSEPKSHGQIQTKEPALSLADYLRRVPGVQIIGSGNNIKVRVRGGSTSQFGDNDPLFVVDGTPVTSNYQDLNQIVDPVDIAHIAVLKDVASTSNYGLRGSNGVILIITRK